MGWLFLHGATALRAASIALLSGASLAAAPTLEQMSDAPDPRHARPAGVSAAPDSYTVATAQWRRAEDLNAWIGANFAYDPARALALAETARAGGASVAIAEPETFFASPRGVCVDLSRFAVETLRRIDPAAQAAYLMIEFEPVRVQGQLLRRHWLAGFRRDGAWWFFADSKRPGHLAGPYGTVERFLAEYAPYRERVIVGHRVLPSYERQPRFQATRTPRSAAD